MTELSEDVEQSSSLHAPGPSEEHINAFNPIARAKRRKTQLPPSRFLKQAGTDQNRIAVAGMVVQAITNVRAKVFRAKHNIAAFNLRVGKPCAVGVELRGEEMYDFLGKVVEVVMPKIKDYEGVSGSSGDSSGDIAWGFEPEVVGSFPEVEVNYDA
ncbi:MAG: hypothetical protein Q9163_004179, partial [Psora crenata]